MRTRIGLTALGLYLGLFIIIFAGWACIPPDETSASEVAELSSGDVVSALDGFATTLYDAGTELAASQDCSYEVNQMKRLCEFQMNNLREYHAREITQVRTDAALLDLKIQSLALYLFDTNGNGRITCAEARSAGIAPVTSDHAAYGLMRDGNSDGIVCE